VVRPELERELRRRRGQRRLRDAVPALERHRLPRHHAVDHDDCTAALALHDGHDGTRELQRPEQIDLERSPPVVEVGGLDGLELARHVGAVDERVDAAERVDGRVDQCSTLLAGAHVGRYLQHRGVETAGADRGFRVVELARRARRDRNAGGTLGRRDDRELDAESRPDAGDEHDFAVEQHRAGR
jgi:hypothetical protein